ncbi:MAG: PAS domain S-box protein [Phycisphaerae bacterium]|nr:PAS domain S-box protein [Phycisphaerae bacterium]
MAEHLATTTTSIDTLNREIAERKRIENELRLSEERFRILFEYAPDAYFLHDLQGRLLDVNQRAEQLTGYGREEQIGRTIIDLGAVPPSQTDRVLSMAAENAAGRPSGPNEVILRRKDGALLTVEVMTLPVTIKGDLVVLGMAHDVTERRKTEEELWRSEERFRQVAESAGEFIWEVDAEGLYTYASPAVEEILGYTPEELVGKRHFYDFFLPQEREGLKTAALEAFARRESFHEFINSNVHRDGHVVVLATSGMPIVDDQGNFTGYRGADTDVTERKRLEEQTRQLHRQIEYVLGVTRTGLDIIDSQFNVQYIDPEWKKVYGDPQGKKCYDYFMGRAEACQGCGVVNALETKQPGVTEQTLVRENNRVIQVTSTPFQNEQGEWLVAEVNADITERKQAEQALRESEVRFRSLVEQAGDGFGLLDAEGRYVDTNGATCRLSGYSRDELLRLSITDVAPLVSREEYAARFQLLVGQPPITFESTYRRKDGTTFPVEATVSVIQVGGVPLSLSLVRDISERKEAERQQAELLQKLSEINQELQDFAHIVSHDLKAPLRAIRVIADWLHADYTDKLDDQGKEYLTLLTSRVDRMQGLIDAPSSTWISRKAALPLLAWQKRASGSSASPTTAPASNRSTSSASSSSSRPWRPAIARKAPASV